MPKEAYGVATLVAAVIAGVLMVCYAGPYRLVSDLQIAWFHTNIVNLSFLLTMLIVAAPLLGAVYLLERRLGTRRTWFTPIWDNLDHITDLPPGKAMMVGVVIVVMGGYFAVKDLGRGALTPLSVRDLAEGRPPRSSYVELTDGTVLEGTNLRFKSNSTVYRYVPVLHGEEKAALFLRVSERDPIRDAAGKIRGVLDRDDMEGELRSQLEAQGLIAPVHYVLGVGRKPEPAVGAWMAAVGLLLCAIGMVWWRVRYAP